MTRVLIGGVGYRHLRDHSFGVMLIDALTEQKWPPHVCVEDVSYNPIAFVQRLQDEAPAAGFGLAIIAGASQRPGRPAGTLSIYRWNQVLPHPGAIHEAVAEAVTGIISLDNTLIIARHFEVLPPTVVVIELEPDAHECGDELTPLVATAFDRARAAIGELARVPGSASLLPEGSLALERVRHSGVVFQQVRDAARR